MQRKGLRTALFCRSGIPLVLFLLRHGIAAFLDGKHTLLDRWSLIFTLFIFLRRSLLVEERAPQCWRGVFFLLLSSRLTRSPKEISMRQLFVFQVKPRLFGSFAIALRATHPPLVVFFFSFALYTWYGGPSFSGNSLPQLSVAHLSRRSLLPLALDSCRAHRLLSFFALVDPRQLVDLYLFSFPYFPLRHLSK